jgi:hypothetical protein
MTSHYPRQRAEVDRKKRRTADITISVSMYLEFTIDFQTNTTCEKSILIVSLIILNCVGNWEQFWKSRIVVFLAISSSQSALKYAPILITKYYVV